MAFATLKGNQRKPGVFFVADFFAADTEVVRDGALNALQVAAMLNLPVHPCASPPAVRAFFLRPPPFSPSLPLVPGVPFGGLMAFAPLD